MRVALIIGKNTGESLRGKLQAQKDNLDIECFEDVASFLNTATKRNYIYDRILVLSNRVVSDVNRGGLYTYWSDFCRDTDVVMLGQDGKDEGLASTFLEMYQSPKVATMLVSTTSVDTIVRALTLPTSVITNKYGIKSYLKVDIEEDEVKEPEPEIEEEVAPNMEQAVTQQPAQVSQPKKKGFFNSLFGGRKIKKEQPQPQQQVADTEQTNVDNFNDSMPNLYEVSEGFNSKGYPDSSGDDFEINYGNSDLQDFNENESYDEEAMESAPLYPTPPENQQIPDFDDFGDDNYSPESETEEVTKENDEFSDDFKVDLGDTFENEETETNLGSPHEIETVTSSIIDTYTGEDVEESDTPSPLYKPEELNPLELDVAPAPIFSDNTRGGKKEPKVDVEDVNDVAPIPISFDNPKTMVQETSSNDVHDIVPNIDVLGSERSYREATEKPKVITETVVKEVIRNVGRGSNIISNIASGKTKKILVVSGDRGSGVTCTAYALAKHLSKYTNVLYLDCDISNHGILNYINYDTFLDYENLQLGGTKYCTSSRNFDNCIIKYGDNIDLLTANFSFDVTKEELTDTQAVVAENSSKYGVVVVDCPAQYLSCIQDLVLVGNHVVCIEASKRGFRNMLCQYESSDLSTRYKRSLVGRGIIFLTKLNKKISTKQLVNAMHDQFVPEDIDWLSMPYIEFNGRLDDNLVNKVLEG